MPHRTGSATTLVVTAATITAGVFTALFTWSHTRSLVSVAFVTALTLVEGAALARMLRSVDRRRAAEPQPQEALDPARPVLGTVTRFKSCSPYGDWTPDGWDLPDYEGPRPHETRP